MFIPATHFLKLWDFQNPPEKHAQNGWLYSVWQEWAEGQKLPVALMEIYSKAIPKEQLSSSGTRYSNGEGI